MTKHQGVVLPQRRFTQLLFFDVEDCTQVLTDALALLDADRVFRPFRYADPAGR